jgi:hypothetical protein
MPGRAAAYARPSRSARPGTTPADAPRRCYASDPGTRRPLPPAPARWPFRSAPASATSPERAAWSSVRGLYASVRLPGGRRVAANWRGSPSYDRSQPHNAVVGWFTQRALPGLLAVIAAAILITALYVIFPGAQCAPGASPAADCVLDPGF